jgi:hypothetical protein
MFPNVIDFLSFVKLVVRFQFDSNSNSLSTLIVKYSSMRFSATSCFHDTISGLCTLQYTPNIIRIQFETILKRIWISAVWNIADTKKTTIILRHELLKLATLKKRYFVNIKTSNSVTTNPRYFSNIYANLKPYLEEKIRIWPSGGVEMKIFVFVFWRIFSKILTEMRKLFNFLLTGL